MDGTEVRIDVVGPADAGELLTLVRAAFVAEAQAVGDPDIAPLTQTLEELRSDLVAPEVITLGGRAGHRLVGSVRIELSEDRATLSRLAVAPDLQNQGIGTRMLLGVLDHLPEGVTQVWVAAEGSEVAGGVANLAEHAGRSFDYRSDRRDLTHAYLRRILADDGA